MAASLETIDEILTLWAEDCKMSSDLKAESIRTSLLHSKYLRIYTHHSLRVKRYTQEYVEMKKTMWRYYAGKFSQEEYKEYNLEPFRESLKSEIAIYLESDPRLTAILLKKSYYEEGAELTKAILKEISNRTFQIKNAIEWLKVSNGMM